MFKLRRSTVRLAVMLPLAALLAATGGCHKPNRPCPSAGPFTNPSAPPTGTASGFVILAGSTVTNTGGTTTIVGSVGTSPGAAITGLPAGQPTGGTVNAGNAAAATAQADLTALYNDLAGRTCDVSLTGQDLGGKTLTPGVYCFSTSAQLTGILTLDAGGDPNAVFIFKIGSTLTTATNAAVVMAGGGQIDNVYWQIGSSATLGSNTTFRGNIAALSSITLVSGTSLTGRALARNGAVTLDNNAVALP